MSGAQESLEKILAHVVAGRAIHDAIGAALDEDDIIELHLAICAATRSG
jgi:hypothetical protein